MGADAAAAALAEPILMSAFGVDAAAGLGLSLSLGDLAAMATVGLTAADIASGAADSFLGANGATNGFYNAGSFNQAIINGANTLTNTTPQLSQQQILQSAYSNAVAGGASPQDALAYAEQAANTTDISALGGAAPQCDSCGAAKYCTLQCKAR